MEVAEAPKLGNVHYELGQIALSTGDPERALAEFEAETVDWKHATGLAMAWHALGQPDKARQALEALLASGDRDLWSFQQAQIHAQWGEPDAAFAALDTAVRVGDPALVAILSDPFLDPLRPDPRFAQLLDRLKLPH
jgi:tetratricopeptide (TPR) repeat protein